MPCPGFSSSVGCRGFTTTTWAPSFRAEDSRSSISMTSMASPPLRVFTASMISTLRGHLRGGGEREGGLGEWVFADEVSYFLFYLFVYSVIWFLFCCVAGCGEVSQLFVFCLVCYLCGRVCGGEVFSIFVLTGFILFIGSCVFCMFVYLSVAMDIFCLLSIKRQ